jgi:phage terminase large subunit-like protein
MGNVVGKPDRRGNLYPAKRRPEQKIDAAAALIIAVGRAMARTRTGQSDRLSAQLYHRLICSQWARCSVREYPANRLT